MFSVAERRGPDGRDASTFHWSELLDLPLGPLGALGWPVVRAGRSRWALRRSLERAWPRHCEELGRAVTAAVVGADGVARCPWGAGDGLLAEYHDTEWGRALHGRDALYERISLEAFQSGLSWMIVLRKRPAFRAAFAGFDPEVVAGFDDDDVERLLGDAGIVRNRAKIVATIDNARAVLALAERGEDLDALLWSFAPDHPAQAPPTALDGRPGDHAGVARRWPRRCAPAASGSSARPPATR